MSIKKLVTFVTALIMMACFSISSFAYEDTTVDLKVTVSEGDVTNVAYTKDESTEDIWDIEFTPHDLSWSLKKDIDGGSVTRTWNSSTHEYETSAPVGGTISYSQADGSTGNLIPKDLTVKNNCNFALSASPSITNTYAGVFAATGFDNISTGSTALILVYLGTPHLKDIDLDISEDAVTLGTLTIHFTAGTRVAAN